MKKEKTKYEIIIPLIIFFVISVISIFSASLSINSKQIVTKQVIWYLIGFIILIITPKKIINKIIDNSFIFYLIGNAFLLLLLIFGTEVNGSKCWFILPGIGSFQPSEFMKLILILTNAKIFNMFDLKYKKRSMKEDIKLFFIILLITLIPSILTFLEPDTGMVIIYFLISFIMLFVYGIRKSIFIILILIMIISSGVFLYFYLPR